MHSQSDVTVSGAGTVYLFTPETAVANAWLDDNVHLEGWPWLGRGFAVEHCYVGPLIEGNGNSTESVRSERLVDSSATPRAFCTAYRAGWRLDRVKARRPQRVHTDCRQSRTDGSRSHRAFRTTGTHDSGNPPTQEVLPVRRAERSDGAHRS